MQAGKVTAFFHTTPVEDLIHTGRVTEHFPAECFKHEREAVILQTAVVSLFLLKCPYKCRPYSASGQQGHKQRQTSGRTKNLSLSQRHTV